MTCSPPDATEAARRRFEERTRLWGGGWRRWVFPGLWLVYLAQTVAGVHKNSTGLAAVVGYLIVAVFAACYLAAVSSGWEGRQGRFWWL